MLRPPEPHHPDSVSVVGAGGGSCMVALLDGPSRADGLDPGSMTDAAIAAELIELRREIDDREARFAQLAWAGHRRGIGAVDGAASTQAWLRHRTGMREGDARAAIESGAATELLPSIGDAWRDGAVTTGAVRTDRRRPGRRSRPEARRTRTRPVGPRPRARTCVSCAGRVPTSGTVRVPTAPNPASTTESRSRPATTAAPSSTVTCPRAPPRSWSPHSTRSPIHPPTATPGQRHGDGPMRSCGWPSSPSSTCRAPTTAARPSATGLHGRRRLDHPHR